MHDVVAIVVDLPTENLAKGCVGTVVEVLDKETYLVEFADKDGMAYCFAALHLGQLLKLYHEPQMLQAA